jgi:hypothetical protein
MTLALDVPRLARGTFLWAALLAASAAAAAPYRPADDAQVLARVPPRPPTAVPELGAAVDAARALIQRSREEGDPRLLGHAEGLLRPWLRRADAPHSVSVLRATLLQARHRFSEALAALDAIPPADSSYAQAQLTRATILRVQGRYADAAVACNALVGRTDDFAATLCEVAIKGLRGELGSALDDLHALKAHAGSRPPDLRAWLATETAEALERSGDVVGAEAQYRSALALATDASLRAAHADLLLRQARAAEVEALLGAEGGADALALRLALARRALGRPDALLEARLVESYGAARRRGEPHWREEALFALYARAEPARALALALENWAQQREPADTLLLAEAALAAGNPEALAEMRAWMGATGYEDRRLDVRTGP